MTLGSGSIAPEIFDNDPWGEELRLQHLLWRRPVCLFVLGVASGRVTETLLRHFEAEASASNSHYVVMVVSGSAAHLAQRSPLRRADIYLCGDTDGSVRNLYRVPTNEPKPGGRRGLLGRARTSLKRVVRGESPAFEPEPFLFLLDQDRRIRSVDAITDSNLQSLLENLGSEFSPPEDLRPPKQRRREEKRAEIRARKAQEQAARERAEAEEFGRADEPESGDLWSPTGGQELS